MTSLENVVFAGKGQVRLQVLFSFLLTQECTFQYNVSYFKIYLKISDPGVANFKFGTSYSFFLFQQQPLQGTLPQQLQ